MGAMPVPVATIVPQIEIARRPGKGRRISFVQAKKVG